MNSNLRTNKTIITAFAILISLLSTNCGTQNFQNVITPLETLLLYYSNYTLGITSHSSDEIVYGTGNVTLNGTLSPARRTATNITVTSNGQSAKSETATYNGAEFSLELTLEKGDNQLEITVEDSTGADSTSNINLVYKPLSLSNGQAAKYVLGQSSFTDKTSDTTASKYGFPVGNPHVADGHLYVTDSGNRRIMGYNTFPGKSGVAADFLIGQADFTTKTANPVGPGSLGSPTDVSSYKGQMLVVDRGFNRGLLYSQIPTTIAPNANLAIGPSALISTASFCDNSHLNQSYGGIVSPDGKLIIADTKQHRVLIWNSIPTTYNQPADLVLGQADFTTCTLAVGTASAKLLSEPTGVWTDGTLLAIADVAYNRVLIWNTFPTKNAQPADIVLGQPNMTEVTDNNGGISASTLNAPDRVTSDGKRFVVADSGNHRVLIWNQLPTTNGQPADVVLGQPNVISNTANKDGIGAATLSAPRGLAIYQNYLLISDSQNSRVLIFQGQ